MAGTYDNEHVEADVSNERYAVVVPADLGRDCYRIDWPTDSGADTGALLREHIECDMFQLLPATGSQYLMWADEEGKMVDPSLFVFNARATSMWHDINGVADVLIGNVVLTSAEDDGEGGTVGLTGPESDELLAMLVEAGDPRRVEWLRDRYGVPTDMVKTTPHLTVRVENAYECGRESSELAQYPIPAEGVDLEDWARDTVRSGDGHPCGTREKAIYECEVILAPGRSDLVGTRIVLGEG